MMKAKKYIYSCDGGSICIGNGACRASFPNGWGDGKFIITVSDETPDHLRWQYRGSIEGTDICVLDYDCYRDDEITEEDILCHLSGRYGVYSDEGDIYLQKWD